METARAEVRVYCKGWDESWIKGIQCKRGEGSEGRGRSGEAKIKSRTKGAEIRPTAVACILEFAL